MKISQKCYYIHYCSVVPIGQHVKTINFVNLAHGRIYIQMTYTPSLILIKTFLPGLTIISPKIMFQGYYRFVINLLSWRFSCPSDNLKNIKAINLTNWPVRGPKGQKSLILWISKILHVFYLPRCCFFGMHVMGYNTIKARTDRTRGLSLMGVVGGR